jgi:hypothetical protein
MTRALKPGGPLADPDAPSGEVEGTMMLFQGAYAVLRNPQAIARCPSTTSPKHPEPS